MANTIEEKFKELEKDLANTLRKLPPVIGEEAVNFSLDNFQAEGWQGDSFEAWPKRKSPNAWGKNDDRGRALLVKTGKLKRSIRVGKIEDDKVQIIAGGADVPYARTHNEGFHGPVKQHVRSHYRRTKKGKQTKVRDFDRIIQQSIPRRQFIGGSGESSQLRSRITRKVIDELKNFTK